MDREVWFSVEGQGYGVPKDGFGNAGVRLTPRPGATRTIEVTRNVRARRLGRIGGSGLFAESEKCGDPPRGAESGEVGRDSVQCQPYGDGLFWLWGDTSLANYPLGVFNVTAARTPNPAFPVPNLRSIRATAASSTHGGVRAASCRRRARDRSGFSGS